MRYLTRYRTFNNFVAKLYKLEAADKTRSGPSLCQCRPKASRSESKPDLADAATRSPASQITSTSTVTVTWTTHPSTQSELELEPTPGLLPSPSIKAILLRHRSVSPYHRAESADETSRPGCHIPFSPATGQQPRIIPVPRAANPRSEASRSSTCSSAMQTTRQEEQEEREHGRSGSLGKHTKQAQVRISYTISYWISI